ncbi:MAG: hypothetical protein WKF77_14935, partial [Planctomycetaceae bacterium]
MATTRVKIRLLFGGTPSRKDERPEENGERAKEWISPIYLDLEKVHSADRFVEVLLSELKPLMSAMDKTAGRFKELLGKLGGTEVGGMVKIPELGKRGWQDAVEETFRAICENNRETRILLMFDELPYMLQAIASHDRKANA